MTTAIYTCDRCNYQRSPRYLDRVYVLDGDRTVVMEQRHFWCGTCEGISVGESLERDKEIVEWYASRLRELRERGAAESIAEIDQLEADWQEWRNARTAPQKCLRCGSPAPDLPPSGMSSFEHGGCGGLLVCMYPVGSSNGPATHAHRYDINGQLLELGSKPKYVPERLTWDYEPMELFSS